MMQCWVDILAAAGSRSIWSDVIPVSLIGGGAALLIWSFWRRQAQPGLHRPKPPTQANASNGNAPHPAIRDAQDLADLLTEQMDRQAHRLEQLISDADARIRKLERLNSAPVPTQTRSALAPDATDPLNRRVYELADEGMPPVEIA